MQYIERNLLDRLDKDTFEEMTLGQIIQFSRFYRTRTKIQLFRERILFCKNHPNKANKIIIL